MRLQLMTFLLLICFSIDAAAQTKSSVRNRSFTDPKSGFEYADLETTTLLVEKFEPIAKNCENKAVLWEVGLNIVHQDYCPRENMTRGIKKLNKE